MADEGIRTAPLGKRWARKMAIFIVVLVGFGGWGFYDAVYAYPARGERFATWAKMAYLEAARQANQEAFGVFERDSSVPDPVAEYQRLKAPEQRQRNDADATNAQSPRRLRAIMLRARLAWLEGLDRIGALDAERTVIQNPRSELERLQAELSTAANPKPLSRWDIPSQWLIVLVCWSLAAVLVARLFVIASRKYRWDAGTMTLTLPGGERVTPADLEEVDKRKWDKFIVFLKIKASHAGLGGREVRLDTYQHDELEDWVLAMQRAAFGSQEEPGAAEPAEAAPSAAT